MTATAAPRDPALVQFGSEVRIARERAGKRRSEFAAEMEISARHLARIERAECRASNIFYLRIASALDVDPASVLRQSAA